MNEKVQPESIPQLVLILPDYQYKNSFVSDHELNTVGCLTEIMQMLIVDSFELRNKDYLKEQILEQSHRDQNRTSIKN